MKLSSQKAGQTPLSAFRSFVAMESKALAKTYPKKRTKFNIVLAESPHRNPKKNHKHRRVRDKNFHVNTHYNRSVWLRPFFKELKYLSGDGDKRKTVIRQREAIRIMAQGEIDEAKCQSI